MRWKSLKRLVFVVDIVLVLTLVIVYCANYRKRLTTANTQPATATLGSSAWFGFSCYHVIPDRREAWRWVIHFIKSLPNIASLNRKIVETDHILFIRFPGVNLSALENETIKDLTFRYQKYHLMNFLRYDCFPELCNNFTASNLPLVRPERPVLPSSELMFVSFLHADINDVKRLIQMGTIWTSVKTLITTVTTENKQQSRDYNYPFQLYNLIHELYFLHHWIPIAAEFERKRYNNQLQIIWTSWDVYKTSIQEDIFERLYIPPAGDGSAKYELQRMSSFLNSPFLNACLSSQQVGGQLWPAYKKQEGAWTICLDNLKNLRPSECLVYSFGVSSDWTFDDFMHAIGCTVISFDPSINLAAHQRGQFHWFYPWGLPASRNSSLPANWKLYPLDTIRSKLGHTDRRINVLKMDVEEAEWTFMQWAVAKRGLESMEQIVLEIHISKYKVNNSEQLRLASFYLHCFEKMGFLLFNSRQNPHCAEASTFEEVAREKCLLYELSFISRKLAAAII